MDTHTGPNASLPPTTTRRTMTLTLGVAAAVLLAGCSSSGGKPESTGSGMASTR
ncbi:hypothetical protein [Rhodococcus sp. NCIMB 12038]|uniref:hypothetical protein n=1 Tax=Rhodococcus sp. NCIMB 12038 TaxID=933800 RepID=UPI00211B6A73|nr:hypothetical protein [Rhodococcus sp. NCIMB 12038]